AAGLLAGLDEEHAAGVRHLLLLQRPDRGQRAEHGIAVIRTAPAIELVLLQDGYPGAGSLRPADHLRLLVEMPIEQYAVLALAGDVDEDDRGASRQPYDLEAGAGKIGDLAPRPALEQCHRFVHVAMRRPVRIEGRRFVGNPDVLDQRRHYPAAQPPTPDPPQFLSTHIQPPPGKRPAGTYHRATIRRLLHRGTPSGQPGAPVSPLPT